MSIESNAEFNNGLAVIYSAIRAALTQGGETDVSVTNSQRASGPLKTDFIARVRKKTLAVKFTVEEIEDSEQTIDPRVATKIRMLANQFSADR